ncbi:MAG: group II intron reverse transcriptase/maturase [Deltaproteobacteria bacterium]|nr:MAG: group II intron reverse transcriptase/maturase [Deltaproteobacteria bacterium]
MTGPLTPEIISTKLQRVAKLAREMPHAALRSLAHHIDLDFLFEAYRWTRKDGATGVDGQTAQEYAEHLEENLRDLLSRAKSGTYCAPPVRRVHIPKGDGRKTRPIGIPTFEDKVLQRAVAMVLDAVYEQNFRDCSYGFRPGRSAHQALQTLWERLMAVGGGWVLELDIEDFFGSLDRGRLREILQQRVRDGVLLRLIGKWLHAGVLEDESLTYPEAGTPQGGVISPVLANVYLHEVLDTWFEDVVRPRMRGAAHLIRFADDAVIVFAREDDARRVMAVLPKRLAKYGLRLHSEKTRLIAFGRPRSRDERPDPFDFLGFTHYWGTSRRGNWVVQRKTARDRLTRSLRAIYRWCRDFRHLPVCEQQRVLGLKLRGHYAYYGITGNLSALARFLWEVRGIWHKWLARRSNSTTMSWERFTRLIERYPLPPPRVVHSIYRTAASP